MNKRLLTPGVYFNNMNQQDKNKQLALLWKEAWSRQTFKLKIIIGTLLLLIILSSFPKFFAIIELRKGMQMNDWILARMPAYDVSIPIFIIIWSTAAFLIYKLIQSPILYLQFLMSFLILCITRVISISIFSLEPPIGLIELQDPLSSIFYGGTNVFIKKDLFYSGHTATQFLIFLSLKGKIEKIITGITTILISVLVLIQHIHYTVDVVAAYFFTYFVYILGKRISTF
jgi:hypothetical protein